MFTVVDDSTTWVGDFLAEANEIFHLEGIGVTSNFEAESFEGRHERHFFFIDLHLEARVDGFDLAERIKKTYGSSRVFVFSADTSIDFSQLDERKLDQIKCVDLLLTKRAPYAAVQQWLPLCAISSIKAGSPTKEIVDSDDIMAILVDIENSSSVSSKTLSRKLDNARLSRAAAKLKPVVFRRFERLSKERHNRHINVELATRLSQLLAPYLTEFEADWLNSRISEYED